MRALFLDFDGVLNEGELPVYSKDSDVVAFVDGAEMWSPQQLDRDKVGRLNTIIEATNAVVIIISSWRTKFPLNTIRGMLVNRGFEGTVLGDTERLHRTPDGQARNRGHEVRAWLKAAGNGITSFCILDDDGYEDPWLVKHLVQTEDGLRDEHVKPAVALLRFP